MIDKKIREDLLESNSLQHSSCGLHSVIYISDILSRNYTLYIDKTKLELVVSHVCMFRFERTVCFELLSLSDFPVNCL